MLRFRLPLPEQFHSLSYSVQFDEHCVYTEQVKTRYEVAEHYASLGLLYSLAGQASFRTNGTRTAIDDQKFLLVNQDTRLSISAPSGSQPFLLYFQSGVPEMIAESLYSTPERLLDCPHTVHRVDFSLLERPRQVDVSLRKRLSLLATLPESCSSFQALKTDALVRSIVEDLLLENKRANTEAINLQVKKRSTRNELYKRLCIAKDWIDNHYTERITLKDISLTAHLNSQHFLRLFRQLFGKTPHQYLIDCRLEEAKRMLASTDLSVAEICNRVGWESLASFSRLFLHRTGYTPASTRNSVS